MKRKNSEFQSTTIVWILVVGVFIVWIITRQLPPPRATPTSTPSLCAANAIPVSVVYSSEVNFYLPAIIDRFNQLSAGGGNMPGSSKPLAVEGKPICVTGEPISAGRVRAGLLNAILAPNNENVLKPTIWSPSANHWLILANHESGRQLFDLTTTKETALAPVVIAIWKSRLEAIRSHVGYEDIGWSELLAVLHSPTAGAIMA